MYRLAVFFNSTAFTLGNEALKRNFPFRDRDILVVGKDESNCVSILMEKKPTYQQVEYLNTGKRGGLVATYALLEWHDAAA